MISNSTTQFHTDPLSSTRRFHTRTTPFQHPKSLSSTPKSPQFHTKNFFVWGVSWTEGFSVRNWGCVELREFGVELRCVELKGFWCGTEGAELKGWNWGVLVWSWGVCGTEGFLGLKRSGPFVWNWCVELRGVWNWGDPTLPIFFRIPKL